MEHGDLLRVAGETLERLNIPYLITGGAASIAYGEPRFTHDIDILIDLRLGKVSDLCEAFPAPEYYVSEVAARQAVLNRGQFNVIHPRSGLKIDMIIQKQTGFDESQFRRATQVQTHPDRSFSFASREDVILNKLKFYREGKSDRHITDIVSMIRVGRKPLDMAYLNHWIALLGVSAEWTAVQSRLESKE